MGQPGACHTVLWGGSEDQAMVDSSDSRRANATNRLGQSRALGGLTRLMIAPRAETNPHTRASGKAKQKSQGTGTRAALDGGHRDTNLNGTGLQYLRITPALPNSKKVVRRPSSCCMYSHHRPCFPLECPLNSAHLSTSQNLGSGHRSGLSGGACCFTSLFRGILKGKTGWRHLGTSF